MKFPVVVQVLISLACLFAVFHSCHGIRCYFCLSKDYAIKSCETISGDEFIHDYGEKADNCLKLLLYKNDTEEKEKRLLFRMGFSEKARSDVDTMIKLHTNIGYKVDSVTCKEDLCNSQ